MDAGLDLLVAVAPIKWWMVSCRKLACDFMQSASCMATSLIALPAGALWQWWLSRWGEGCKTTYTLACTASAGGWDREPGPCVPHRPRVVVSQRHGPLVLGYPFGGMHRVCMGHCVGRLGRREVPVLLQFRMCW